MMRSLFAGGLAVLFLGASPPADRRSVLTFTLDAAQLPPESQAGEILVRFTVPLPVLDEIGGDLGRLSIRDEQGEDVEYRLERSPASEAPCALRLVRSEQIGDRTVAVYLTEPAVGMFMRGLSFEVADAEFDGVVTVEGSDREDRGGAETFVERSPIFRRPGGELTMLEMLRRPVPKYLIVTVTRNSGSRPIAFRGVKLTTVSRGPSTSDVELALSGLTNGPEQSWLQVDLPARHLEVERLKISPAPDAAEPRTVRLLALGRRNGVMAYEELASSPASPDGQGQAIAPVGRTIASRDLVIVLENGRERPWRVESVKARVRLPEVVFRRKPGQNRFALYYGGGEGNGTCREALPASPLFEIGPGAIAFNAAAANPEHRPAPDLVALSAERGASIATDPWTYRRPLSILGAGVHRLELDAEILGRSRPDRGDLRLVEEGFQVPYIVVATATPLEVALEAEGERDGSIGRWILELPAPSLPITHLVLRAQSPIFRREIQIYEEVTNPSGRSERRKLGAEVFTRTGEEAMPEVVLRFSSAPTTSRIILEVENGDNAPLNLGAFRVYMPNTMLLFKKTTEAPCYLYYGHPEIDAPVYDLGLVARSVEEASPLRATMGEVEVLRRTPWWKVGLGGPVGTWAYWIAMGLVVVGLVVAIVKLVPEEPAQ